MGELVQGTPGVQTSQQVGLDDADAGGGCAGVGFVKVFGGEEQTVALTLERRLGLVVGSSGEVFARARCSTTDRR
ncbi:hypothetical protein BJF83_22885 [Nocardiopsis sp. CNR-923]|nr:hypothetical protein BJF83_22885 [Nocardiopsis sp. CNR-923]